MATEEQLEALANSIEQAQLKEMRDFIAEIPKADQKKVADYAQSLRNVFKTGDKCFRVAFALVGAELAAELDEKPTKENGYAD